MKPIQARTFDFAVRIIRLCGILEDTPGVSRTISRQLSRSGTSIGANIREAKGAQSRADFIAKNHISLKEAHETVFWLELLVATDLISEKSVAALILEANNIVGVLTNILKKTKTRKR